MLTPNASPNLKFKVGDFIRESDPSEWKKGYPNDCAIILGYFRNKDWYKILFIEGFAGLIEWDNNMVRFVSREGIDNDYSLFDITPWISSHRDYDERYDKI